MSTAEALRSMLATVGIESVPADPGVQAGDRVRVENEKLVRF